MTELSSKERRALRARAHKLDPVVIVGGAGLSEPVIEEIDRNLNAHGLIKVRAAEADREGRDALMQAVCERTGAAPVQQIGKMLVLYRERPAQEPEARPAPKRKARPKARAPARGRPAPPARRGTPPARTGRRTARR